MKNKFVLTVFVLIAASGSASAATNDVATLVERGLFEEEANHQLDAAIGDYKEAIAHFDHDRQLAATAIFRLGECYRKQGRTNEANAQYERITREFPDQTQLAQLSRGYLPASAIPGLAAGSPPLPSDEAEFLSKAIKSFQTSPDLVNEQLRAAIDAGYVSAAEFLLAHGADAREGSRLCEAARQGNEAMVRLLLAHGADVNYIRKGRNSSGDTPLSLAVGKGFRGVCLTLLSNGADVNLRSPLVMAAHMGNEAMVEILLSHGAAINKPDGEGSTALSCAVENGSWPLCQTLVAHGADVNKMDKNGSTPLHLAVENDNLAVTEFLITNKAQMDAKTAGGETPLLAALVRGNTNMVKLLLDHHADANMETSFGGSWWLNPLDWAIFSDHPQMVNLLLQAHADPNAPIKSPPASSQDPFGYFGIQRMNGGPFPEPWRLQAKPVPGLSPLLWALLGAPPHLVEIAQLLLDKGANPNAADPAKGTSVLNYAIDHEMVDVVRLLAAHGADVNAFDDEGRPPLAHLQSPLNEKGHQMEELLIKAGADADYNRRRAIWVCGVGGTPKAEIFQCPTNSINHYTLLEFLATLYAARPGEPVGGVFGLSRVRRSYAYDNDLVAFPDFTRVSILRLDGKQKEVLHVNVTDILHSGDVSKDVALQAGDMIDIAQLEHKVADEWTLLPQTDVTAFDKCLLRSVYLVAQGKTNMIALAPSLGVMNQTRGPVISGTLMTDLDANMLAQSLHGRKPDTVVHSFLLNTVVRHSDVLLNTWDLSRVRLKRGGAKWTFDLTKNPAPDVWLEEGDVIDVSEVGEGASATESK